MRIIAILKDTDCVHTDQKNMRRCRMNRWKHRIPGGILAVLLAAVFALPAYPKAGDEVVKIDFDDGTVCGFETYTEGGACSLENDNGALAVKITSCGHLDYANQAYWDGFSLEQNCQYRYSFDISCSIDRQVEYRLQLNGGDYHAYLGERIRVGQEPSHISVDWTMTEESDPAPRLCFNMGFEEDMAQDPGAHTVWIDHISLTVLDDSGVSEDAGDAAGESSQEVGVIQHEVLCDIRVLGLEVHLDYSGHGGGEVELLRRRPRGTGDASIERCLRLRVVRFLLGILLAACKRDR